jgi:Ser/Thr protein kinase RdoA (MazF antagonist)
MPPFPDQIVHTMLSHFGIEEVNDLKPWPYGPFDILAAFSFQDIGYLLKVRYFEHRGERSLFETHYIQKKLLELGLPVAPLFAAPDGETLLKGPDWQDEGEAYYEIQEILPGQFLVPNEDTLKQAGELAANLHETGSRVDTFLLEKSEYRDYFMKNLMGVPHQRFKAQIEESQSLSPQEAIQLEQVFDCRRNPTWKGELNLFLIHGNFCPDNVLVNGEQTFLIDFEEVGLGEVSDDLCSLILNGPELEIPMIQAFLNAYQDGGGVLFGDDRLILYSNLVRRDLRKHVDNSDPFKVSEVFDKFSFLKET